MSEIENSVVNARSHISGNLALQMARGWISEKTIGCGKINYSLSVKSMTKRALNYTGYSIGPESFYAACIGMGRRVVGDSGRFVADVWPQEKPGANDVVYFIQPINGGPIKIGWSSDVKRRLAALNSAHPYELTILGTIRGSVRDERRLHHRFSSGRLQGEWFEPSEELLAFIKDKCRV